MSNVRLRLPGVPGACLLLLLAFLSACYPSGATPPGLQELRIVNTGSTDITGLIVLFPGPTSDAQATQVEFGNIPAGKTTEYRSVPGGVYRYSAFQYTLEGHPVNQPVVDWVGEKPMAGTRFTYQIQLDPTILPGRQIQLIQVVVDTP